MNVLLGSSRLKNGLKREEVMKNQWIKYAVLSTERMNAITIPIVVYTGPIHFSCGKPTGEVGRIDLHKFPKLRRKLTGLHAWNITTSKVVLPLQTRV